MLLIKDGFHGNMRKQEGKSKKKSKWVGLQCIMGNTEIAWNWAKCVEMKYFSHGALYFLQIKGFS